MSGPTRDTYQNTDMSRTYDVADRTDPTLIKMLVGKRRSISTLEGSCSEDP
jgi:hypothetical protein